MCWITHWCRQLAPSDVFRWWTSLKLKGPDGPRCHGHMMCLWDALRDVHKDAWYACMLTRLLGHWHKDVSILDATTDDINILNTWNWCWSMITTDVAPKDLLPLDVSFDAVQKMTSFILGCYLPRCFSLQMPCASSLMLRSVARLRWMSHCKVLDGHSDGAIFILDGLVFLFDLHSLMSGDVILMPWDARAWCRTFR